MVGLAEPVWYSGYVWYLIMMNFKMVLLGLLVLLLLGSCDSDTGWQSNDQTWVVTYILENSASSDLVLSASGAINATELLVPAGETVQFGHYEWFLGPDPSIDRDIWCLSISRENSPEIVAQYSPATAGPWTVETPAEYERLYTLVLADGDLGEVSVLCPRVEGTVRDAVSDTVIHGAIIDIEFQPPYYGHQFSTDQEGRFGFWLPRDIPAGELRVAAQGYQLLHYSLPDSLVEVSPGVFGGDWALSPTAP